MNPAPARWVLFGAFDRHNLGDLLMPHVLAALLPGQALVFAGLQACDLRAVGGHHVRALAEVAGQAAECDAVDDTVLLHVGGEVLTTTAWQAAAMGLPPAEAAATIAYLARRGPARRAWVAQRLGGHFEAPYVQGGRCFGRAPRSAFVAAGGVGLAAMPTAHRRAVVRALRNARVVTVRDRLTQAALQDEGVVVALLPDAAVMVAELFGPVIARHAAQGEVAALRAALPQGHIAVQCSAEFAADAHLAELAARLTGQARAQGTGLALMRAGAAPWHDDTGVLERLAARVAALDPAVPVRRLGSLHLWDLCALVASAQAVVASSLHVGIVAQAFGRPLTRLRSPAAAPGFTKHEAFALTWDAATVPLPARFRTGFAELLAAVQA